MAHEHIDAVVANIIAPTQSHIKTLEDEIQSKTSEASSTDSKSREAQLRAELTLLRKERQQCWNSLEKERGEVFKTLLAAEYDFPRDHPKFDKVYAYAYQQGHGSGYGDVECIFSEVVELVKD